jgi:UDP-N-acetylglucosamine 3-dehydrogenase
VYGLLMMGEDESIGAEHRLIGTKGVIEVDWPVVRVRGKGDKKWETHGGKASKAPVTDGVLEIVDALRTGRESALSAKKAYAATEVIFAAYESSRRRGRVDLPLEIDDNPLASMIEAGQIGPHDA